MTSYTFVAWLQMKKDKVKKTKGCTHTVNSFQISLAASTNHGY